MKLRGGRIAVNRLRCPVIGRVVGGRGIGGRGARGRGGWGPRRPGNSLESSEEVLRDRLRLQHGVRWNLGKMSRVSLQESSWVEELVRLLLRTVAQGLNDARGNSIRIEVAARPVKEVPFAEGRGSMLHELGEVRILPNRPGPLLGRRNPKTMSPAFALYPFDDRQRFGFPVPGGASQERGKAVPEEVRQ
jgi:hypothetical protein